MAQKALFGNKSTLSRCKACGLASDKRVDLFKMCLMRTVLSAGVLCREILRHANSVSKCNHVEFVSMEASVGVRWTFKREIVFQSHKRAADS